MKKHLILMVLMFSITVSAFHNQTIQMHIRPSGSTPQRGAILTQENEYNPNILRIEVQLDFSNGKEYTGNFYSVEEDADSVSIRVYVIAAGSISLSIIDFRIMLNDELMCDEPPDTLVWEHMINRLFSTEDDYWIEGCVKGYYALNDTIYDAQCMVSFEFAPIPLLFPTIVPPFMSISIICVGILGIIFFFYRKYKKRAG